MTYQSKKIKGSQDELQQYCFRKRKEGCRKMLTLWRKKQIT